METDRKQVAAQKRRLRRQRQLAEQARNALMFTVLVRFGFGFFLSRLDWV